MQNGKLGIAALPYQFSIINISIQFFTVRIRQIK